MIPKLAFSILKVEDELERERESDSEASVLHMLTVSDF